MKYQKTRVGRNPGTMWKALGLKRMCVGRLDGDVPAVLNFGQMTSVMLVRPCLSVYQDAGPAACALSPWPVHVAARAPSCA